MNMNRIYKRSQDLHKIYKLRDFIEQAHNEII